MKTLAVPLKEYDVEELYTSLDFQREFNVSRETMGRIGVFVGQLAKWQKAVNLVSTSSLVFIWERHIRDCAQLIKLGPKSPIEWIDLGSGAGLPGLVLSLLGGGPVYLIESDTKKCIFLREVIRLTNANARVLEGRIEVLADDPLLGAVCSRPHLITARAVAPLGKLLDLAAPFCEPDTICLFPKGQDVGCELTKTTKYPNIEIEKLPSITSHNSVILRIRGLGHGNQ